MEISALPEYASEQSTVSKSPSLHHFQIHGHTTKWASCLNCSAGFNRMSEKPLTDCLPEQQPT